MNAAQTTAAQLTTTQRAALRACIQQDPTGDFVIKPSRNRPGSRCAVSCDGRHSPALITAGILGHARHWDGMFVVLPFGRDVAACMPKD
jgi:hypothetical protein